MTKGIWRRSSGCACGRSGLWWRTDYHLMNYVPLSRLMSFDSSMPPGLQNFRYACLNMLCTVEKLNDGNYSTAASGANGSCKRNGFAASFRRVTEATPSRCDATVQYRQRSPHWCPVCALECGRSQVGHEQRQFEQVAISRRAGREDEPVARVV